MRITLVNPNTNRSTTQQMLALAQQAAGSHVTVDALTAGLGVPLICDEVALAVAADAILALLPTLVQSRPNGVIIAAFGDPGRDRLSGLLACPVIGIAQAAMTEAAIGGRRFCVVTTTPDLVPAIIRTARGFGLGRECIGVRLTPGDPAALMADAAPQPPAPPAPALPATVAGSAGAGAGGASRLRWRNPVRPAEVLWGLCGMGAFTGVLAVFWTVIRAGGEDLPIFVYGVAAFIGGGFGLAVVAQVRCWWRDGHRRYGLDFGPDSVDYVEEASATGRETLRHAVPRAEWYGLNTSFGGNAPDHDPTVLLLTRAAHAQLLHERALRLSLSIGELLAAALTASLARPLRVKQLRPAQRLALVLWARAEAARTHTGS